jgi:hypothetical protein
MLDENLEGSEEGHSNADSHLRIHGPDLPTPVSSRSPDNVATARTSMKALNPFPKDSMEGKQRKTNSHQSEISSRASYKNMLKVRENRKQVK